MDKILEIFFEKISNKYHFSQIISLIKQLDKI